MRHSRRRVSRNPLRVAALVLAALLTMLASPALGAEGSIDHVENAARGVQVLYSLPGKGTPAPDLGTLHVDLDGTPLQATATLASDATTNAVKRTAILAIDVSQSMRADGKFVEAKRAAQIFLDSAPADLYVGIVTFAGTVNVAQQPSRDRTASAAVLQRLSLSLGTRLYDGLARAVAAGGKDGQRSVIVLSDGRDTSATKLSAVTAAIKKSGVKVDVVALAQSAPEEALLTPLSNAGGGSVISADDPKALGQVFASEAQSLARQILITADAPTGTSAREGTLTVAVDAGGESYSDAAFVNLEDTHRSAPVDTPAPSTNLVPAQTGRALTRNVMVGGLAAIGVATLIILVGLFGGFGKPKESVEDRIGVYTRQGRGKRAATSSSETPQGMTAQAVGMATRALESNRGIEARLSNRLDGAAVSLKPAEWLLVHAGIGLGVTAAAFALTGGNILFGLVGLLLGAFVPWFWLGRKRSKRLKAFNAQLAPCLQLMAGSMQAGLSLAQSLDTVVREGQEPLAGEFRRALVETRLGVPIEGALDSISGRMESADFKWTVMAIRIQREVGGNLAELLLNVAATLREREYLRRQVKSLSAEGRFSAYILLALPPGIIAYMMVANPAYLDPMVSSPIDWAMLVGMMVLMGLGAFTMSRLIKVEV
jgi:tight adherence protein B